MREIALVEVEPVRVGIALRRLPVDHEHARDLRQLGKNNLVFVFYSANDTVLKKVSITFVFFTSCKFYKTAIEN